MRRAGGFQARPLTNAKHENQQEDRFSRRPHRDRVAARDVRALPKAPVATPLHWDELSDRKLSPQGWTVKTIQDRLADGGDPWQGLAKTARRLPAASRPQD